MERFFISKPDAAGHADYDFDGNKEQLPTYREANGNVLYWSNRSGMQLPNVGDQIMITMNNIGPAIVHGYFASGDFLGVMTKALNPPTWLKRQNKEDAKRADLPRWSREGIGCEFGGEIKPYERGDATKHSKRLKEINKSWAIVR